MPHNRMLGPLCVIGALVSACGKSPTTPTEPQPPAQIVNTYAATLNLAGGLSGTLVMRAANSLASLEPAGLPVWSRLLAWFELPLAAQSSTATGLLMVSNGDTATLSGTYSGSTFSLSGGGYSVVADVTNTSAGTSISGTASVPGGGTTTVSSAPSPPVTTAGAPKALDKYSGPFHIETTMSMINRRVSDNGIELNCTFHVVNDGNITVKILRVVNDTIEAELTGNWTESHSPQSCKLGDQQLSAVPPSVQPETSSSKTFYSYFAGSPASLTFVRAFNGVPNDSGKGSITSVESYLGRVTGSQVSMTVARNYKFENAFTSTTSGPITSVMYFPLVYVDVTLTR